MNHEASNTFETREENLKPIEQFDSLLEQIAEGRTGWLELPEKEVKDPAYDKLVPARLYAFVPGPLVGYESARYSPSLTLEIGDNEYTRKAKETEGSTQANSKQEYNLKRTCVKRDYLDESSPYYEAKHRSAVEDLARIELAVKLYIEASVSSEQN